MSQELELLGLGGSQALGAAGKVYNDLIIGPGGDIERVTMINGDVASNCTVIEDGELNITYSATAYNTYVVGGSEVLHSGGSSYNSFLASGGRQTVNETCFAQGATVDSKGAQWVVGGTANETVVYGLQQVSKGGIVNNTVIMAGGSQKLYSTSNDTTVSLGGTMMVYKGATLGGDTNVYGRVRFISSATAATTGNVKLHMEGRNGSETALVEGSLDSFAGNTGFYISVANSQESGDYYISEGMSSFSGSITLTNIHGEALGSLTLGNTLTNSYGSYTLSIKKVALNPSKPTVLTDVLTLTISTKVGDTTWPSDWFFAPATVKSTGATGAFNIAQDAYKTDGAFAAKVNGAVAGITSSATADDVYVTVVAGGNLTKFEGGATNNYVFVNGGTVAQLLGATTASTQSVNFNVGTGSMLKAVMAAGMDTTVLGNVNMTIDSGSSTAHTANIFGGVVASKDAAVSGSINISVDSGVFTGLLFGGGRAQGTSGATVTANDITINIANAEFKNNIKFLGSATSDWIVAGVQAIGQSGSVNGTVNINVADATVGKIVAGGQAQGTGASSNVNAAKINISGATTITGDIYGGGYSAAGGSTLVNSTEITIDASNSIAIMGGIYGGGANPLATGSNKVTSLSVVFSGKGDNLSFNSVIDAIGRAGNEVVDSKLTFKAFSGEFNATIKNFETISFTGNCLLTATTMAMAADTLAFDFTGRTKANYGSTFANGFAATDDTALVLDFTTSNLSASNTFALMNMDSDILNGNSVDLNIGGINFGKLTFGETSLVAGRYGKFSCSMVEGVATIKFEKGVLA